MKTEFKTWKKKFIKEFRRDWQLYLLILIPVIYTGVYSYGPMYGIQIGFRDFLPNAGITGSQWVGLRWFEKFLNYHKFGQIFMNTLILSLYQLSTFPLAVILALVINALKQERYAKVIKTVSYVPHFISTVVMVSILNLVLSPVSGIYGNLYRAFGGVGYPTDIRPQAAAFRHLYVWSGVWQQLGWNSIIYVSALSGVSAELHEAAQIDGASRFKRMIHIDLPSILPTVCIMFIMRCGHVISVGFEKVYLMQYSMNTDVSEVISTYVYKNGMNNFKNFSYGSAIGLFNTVINVTLLLMVNKITDKLTSGEISLF